jgi:citrate synthase
MTTKGLEGIVAAVTRISRVRGEAGQLTYAGYEIEDLAQNASFEEVCHLLLAGTLPTRTQLATLRAELRAAAPLDPRVLEIVRVTAPHGHPMSVLRTAIAAAGVFDPDGEDRSPAALARKAVRLTAQAVTITAATGRFRAGEAAVSPRDDLDLAANFLYMMRGSEPDPVEARTLDVAFVLHADLLPAAGHEREQLVQELIEAGLAEEIEVPGPDGRVVIALRSRERDGNVALPEQA